MYLSLKYISQGFPNLSRFYFPFYSLYIQEITMTRNYIFLPLHFTFQRALSFVLHRFQIDLKPDFNPRWEVTAAVAIDVSCRFFLL